MSEDTGRSPELQEFLSQRREILIDLLSKHIRPACSPADADNMFTTPHIVALIDSHSPGIVEPELLRVLLLESGYVEHFIQGEFLWLVKLK